MSSIPVQKARLVALCIALLLCALTACTGAQNKPKTLDDIQDADWYYQSGAGYFEGKQVPLAIRDLHIALDKDPKHVQAHYLLGYIYMGRRQYNKSVQHFKAALDQEPNFHDAINSLGAAYLALGRWHEALELFERLIEEPLYTSPELAHNNAGWAYYNLKEYSQALQHFQMSVFLKPQFCLGYNNLGLAQVATKQPQEAVRSYRKAIELCPANYAEPHFHLAKVYQDYGEMAEARAHFTRCTELASGTPIGDRCREYLSY